MSTEQNKTSKRGRPKTLDRAKTLDAAIQSYWSEGTESISVNEVCRRAGISKPGLYREFGNEDALMKQALIRYADKALAPMHVGLEQAQSFPQVLEALISFATADHSQQGNPPGCMFVDMSASRAQLGPETRGQIDTMQADLLLLYEQLVDQGKVEGSCPATIPTPAAAAYINAQLHSAMAQQAKGESPATIEAVLRLAFSIFG